MEDFAIKQLGEFKNQWPTLNTEDKLYAVSLYLRYRKSEKISEDLKTFYGTQNLLQLGGKKTRKSSKKPSKKSSKKPSKKSSKKPSKKSSKK